MQQQQKKQNKNNNGENNNNNNNNNKGAKKKQEETSTSTTVVLKVDMHHGGCASKILQYFRGVQAMKLNLVVGGVENNAKEESEVGKLTITGKVDPSKVTNTDNNLAHIKKSIDLISSALPNNNNNNNNNKNNNKKPKELPVTTVVLKVELHCQGCMERIRNTVSKTKGVQEVSIDKDKETVTVKGTMEAKALVGNLMRRLRRKVEVVPPSKKGNTKEVDNKEKVKESSGPDKGGGGGAATAAKKKKGGDGGDKGEGGGGGGGGGGDGDGDANCGGKLKQSGGIDFPAPTLIPYGYGFNYEPLYMSQVNAPQIFSDENPNACSVM